MKKGLRLLKDDVLQQGDILLVPIAAIPKGAKRHPSPVLVLGEATGHAHAAVADVECFEDESGTLYLKATPKAEGGSGEVTVEHNTHGPVQGEAEVYEVRHVTEYDHFAEEAREIRD